MEKAPKLKRDSEKVDKAKTGMVGGRRAGGGGGVEVWSSTAGVQTWPQELEIDGRGGGREGHTTYEIGLLEIDGLHWTSKCSTTRNFPTSASTY